ncbi:DHBP synthase RibB-like alpha/beta domain-containing protein [Syncephalastrum racemosum]|uniref:Threonylcarbamoyl-AMP synthase n=1 Tax=Syncephalastrum racemosum TaxID=13706 RepID=A0A1X2H5Y8_SYNRA|nr:DHBP synthase RibB-like alpha/beta domain-containing protein [Syncephalastrum racemosum]
MLSRFVRTMSSFTTRVIPVDPAQFSFKSKNTGEAIIRSTADEAAIDQAVQALRAGEAVGMPTETVYGLAANALSAEAVQKIFAAKNRPQDNPLIVHVSSLAMLEELLPNKTIPPQYIPVLDRFWPGALTIIVPSASIVPSAVTCGQPTVAVRFPSHPVARALIAKCGFPLAAPSANASGRPSPTLASHVYHDLQSRIPLVLDGGPCDVGVESTVLDAVRNPPAILRPGGVTYEDLKPLLPNLQVYQKHFTDKQLELAPTTPGMKYRHYSPDALVVLVEDTVPDFDARCAVELDALRQSHTIAKVGYLRTRSEASPDEADLSVAMGSSADQFAQALFRGLRSLDDQQVDVIFVQGISEEKEGMAVMNRLRKAASRIIAQ